MPPRQDISAPSFDRSMRPCLQGSDGQQNAKPSTNDQEEGGNVVAFPRPDERSLAPNTLLLGGSGAGQNLTLTEQEGILQRIQQLQFVEQQRLRALNQHLIIAHNQRLATGQRDPRLSVLGAPMFLASHPTSPSSFTSSNAAAVVAHFARRREQEDEILFNRQLVAMDAKRWERLIAGRNLSNRTSGSTGGIPGSELRGIPPSRINRLDERGLLLSGYNASILEATRRASMPTLTGTTASAHLHRSAFPFSHGSLTLEMSRAPIVEGRGPLTPEMSQSLVIECRDGSGSTRTNPSSNDEKSTAPFQSVIGRLIERFTSGGTKEASFPLKLHAILVNPEYQDCICWLPHGLSWRIIRMSKFETEVIPRHFRHTKATSFMRQVNGWEFSRNPMEANSYSHPLFVRDDPARCLKMVRFGATKNAAGLSVTEQKAYP